MKKIKAGMISSSIPRHMSSERRKYLEEQAQKEKEKKEQEKN